MYEAPRPRLDSPEIWFDVSQMIVHFGRYGKPTGIERLTCSLLAEMRKRPDAGQTHLYRIDPGSGRFHEVDWALLDLIAESARADRGAGAPQPFSSGGAPGRLARRVYELLPYDLQPAMRQLAIAGAAFAKATFRILKGWAVGLRHGRAGSYGARLKALTLPESDPPPGSTLVNLGATWNMTRHIGSLADLKRRIGIKYVVIIHDVISLAEPDFCPGYFLDIFRAWLVDNLKLADRVLAISDYTRRELLAWCAKADIAAPAIDVIPLAHEAPAPLASLPPLPASLLGAPYALFVSTIEPRKNHVLLLEVWKRLIAAHGASAPKLVFVGNKGWASGDLLDRLASCHWLDGHIVWLAGAGDALLQSLYRSCRFTIYPSLLEGWGLPVGESLAFGKPCIASNRSSIPEVGEEFAEYFDPTDLRECYALVETYSFDDSYLKARERFISDKFRPRLWRDVAAEISAVLDSVQWWVQSLRQTA